MTIKSILRRSFVNPFSIILISLAAISFVTDVLFASNFSRNFSTFLILLTMYLISAVIRFVQELKSKRTADFLSSLAVIDVTVWDGDHWRQVPGNELKNGDRILLEAGMKIPSSVKLFSASDFYVSESAITGESDVFEKSAGELCRAGSIVVGGKAEGVVEAQKSEGKKNFSSAFSSVQKNQSFDRGASSIAKVLLRFAVILIPLVFVISFNTRGDLLRSFLFALSVGVGLIPEMLPMVVNACLAHGSSVMGRKQTVVKNIDAMQSFASLDVLCVDKTGTLTEDKILLEYYMDIFGNESKHVLEYAYINSLYHSGVKNILDSGILAVQEWNGFDGKKLEDNYQKLDSLPFDYQRKIASVLVRPWNNSTNDMEENILIVKGGVEEILNRCSFFEYRNHVSDFDEDCHKKALEMTSEMSADGMKIVAVASKKVQDSVIAAQDECNLTLLGFLAFFDAPKQSALSAIEKLRARNVSVRVLSGDKKNVTQSICRRLKFNTENMLTGVQLQNLKEDEILQRIESTAVFAELTPEQKSFVIKALQCNGHTVGFLGDGLNDINAVTQCDAGISVENSVAALKECSNVILGKKDLNVLEEGIVQGRKAFMNMTKYIKITASSNFGNIFSIVLASVLLPFFPMSALQLLLLNLLYDTLCLSLPWDNVDEDECEKPLEWSGRSLGKFMRFFGPVSSLFDVITFVFLYFVLCPTICGGSYGILTVEGQNLFARIFQTGWFLESLWTQVLILLLLRTKKIPFMQSSPSRLFQVVTILGIIIFTSLIYTTLGNFAGFYPLPAQYYLFLFAVAASYLGFMTVAKKIYIRKNKTLY